MKKLFFLVMALFAFTTSNAQKIVTDDVDGVDTVKVSTNHGTDEEVNYLNSGAGFDYLFIENGYGLGYNMVFKHLLIDLEYRSADNDYFDSSSWSVGLGGQYRYWFCKWLYIEGRLGVQYLHTSVKVKSTDDKASDGSLGLFITPRLGVKLFKNYTLVAGYRWDIDEFKFKKDYTADYFSIGLNIVM